MNNLRYAIEKSYTYMVEEINNILCGTIYSVEERQRLFYACGTCLHWILDYAERVNILEEDKKMVSAFRFVNNALKHDINLFELTEQTGGIEFPMKFPVVIEKKEVRWKALKDNGRFKAQQENYVAYLQGKSVIESCKIVIDMLLNV